MTDISIDDFVATPTAQEKSRQDFVVSLRRYAGQTLGAGVYDIYKANLEPKFEQAHGRKPQTASEVRDLMLEDGYHQFWSAVQRNSQEMIWDSVIDTVERYRDDVKEIVRNGLPLGSLQIDPNFSPLKYHDAYDIHLMPGGYHTDQVDDDVAAGMIYDLGVPIYSLRKMGAENDSNGRTLVNAYKNLYPDAQPQRILDAGCAIGNSTLDWARAFPDAQVHGIDVAAPCLRYGHARANSYGLSVNFSQHDAADTDFPDNYFDVVASALMFHETSNAAVPRILAEMQRILKPGGVMIHFDGFAMKAQEPILEFLSMWEVHNNNEYFLKALQSLDVVKLSERAGLESVRWESQPYLRTAESETGGNKKGYMSGSGFTRVNLLVAERPCDKAMQRSA